MEELESRLVLVLIALRLAVAVDDVDSEDHSLMELLGDTLGESFVTDLKYDVRCELPD